MQMDKRKLAEASKKMRGKKDVSTSMSRMMEMKSKKQVRIMGGR